MALQNAGSTVLVTGSNGQLGRELQQLSPTLSGWNFVFTTRNELSITDTDTLSAFFNRHQVDYCINCAAYTGVDKAEKDAEAAFLINATAVGELAEICRDHATKLIHISTDYVYDGRIRHPLTETSPVGPVNVYGASKLKGEQLALAHNSMTLVIRTSWVYSSYGNNFVKTILRLLSEKDEINVINDQLGSPTYAANLARIISVLMGKMKEGKDFSGIVNYADAGVTSWYEFAVAIKAIVGSSCQINPVASSAYKTDAKRPEYSVLDTAKIRTWLPYEIPAWQTSLQECLDVLSSRPAVPGSR